jgi:hypothetical protein
MDVARFTVDVRNPEPSPDDDDPQATARVLGDVLGIAMCGLWAHY